MKMERKEEEVALADIEQELVRLWESYDATGKVRACLFTLVVYCEDEARLDYMEQLVRMVLERFPCRILFIHSKPSEEKYLLRTSVSTETTKKGDTTLACDRISITAAGKALVRIPYLVLPHLVPDLPVYLLWGQDPTTDCTVLPQLEKFCTRFIFDSDCTDDLKRFTTQLLGRLRSHDRATVDVTWAKLRAWRDVTVHAFCSPDRVMQLAQSKRITITYHDRADVECRHTHFAATYFQAWLAARLTWKPLGMESAEGQQRITYTNGIQRCEVVLQPVRGMKVPSGALVALSFVSHQGGECLIERQDSSRMVRISFSSKEHCEIPITMALSSLDRNSMLMNEIFYEGSSDHYRSMLQMLAQLQVER